MKCISPFDFNDVLAGMMDLNEISSVSYCVCSLFSHEGRLCAELTGAVLRASQ